MLIIRADANRDIGAGHMMRCLALAQACQDAGDSAVFLTHRDNPWLEIWRHHVSAGEIETLEAEPGSLEDARQTARLARERNAGWVIADGYHFDDSFQEEIKKAGHHLLYVDDVGHCRHYYADLILNQNVYANERMYPRREPHTRLLLGTRYVLLRREFLKENRKREIPGSGKRVLVTLGGGDSGGVIFKIIEALSKLKPRNLEVALIAGKTSLVYESLRTAVHDLPFPFRMERDVVNMSHWMAWADVAISGAGSTAWELAFMGVPSLLLILAENQRSIAESLGHRRVFLNMGWWEDASAVKISRALKELFMSTPRRVEMARLAQALVDGQGVQRVRAELGSRQKSLVGERPL